MPDIRILHCNGCSLDKPETDFAFCRTTARGRQSICRVCRHERHLVDWAINGDARRARGKKYRDKNKEKCRQMCRDWHVKNRESVLARLKKRPKSRTNAYQLNRRNTFLHVKLYDNIRRRVNEYMKGGRSVRTRELLGCDTSFLRSYLEAKFKPGMSWENYGFGTDKWHLDHIRPCASFDLTDPEQQKQCFHHTNLQPLWQWENVRKSAIYVCPATGEKRNYRKPMNQWTTAAA